MSKSKSAKAQTFVLGDREKCEEPLHYTACGLDNIYLANGFTRRTTTYGTGVSVDNVEGLHLAIGKHLIHKPGPLAQTEFRFLRNHLGLTQSELAAKLFTEEQNVGRWERGDVSIPGPADKLLRTLFYVVTCSEEELQAFMEEIGQLMEKTSSGEQTLGRHVFFKSNKTWDEVRIS